jgi:xanthine dehydrogenase accessory factor
MIDIEIYNKIILILNNDKNVAIATVISTSGSTPAKIGAKILIWENSDEILGTVGGGCIESEIISRARIMIQNNESKLLKFTLTEDDVSEGSICGGSLEVLIQTFTKNDKKLFEDAVKILENGEKGAFISYISSEKLCKKLLVKNIAQIKNENNNNISLELIESVKRVIDTEQPLKKILEDKTEVYIEPITEQPMLFVFGAGHLSYFIVRFAKIVGFNVTVCDDRIKFANKNRFPESDLIIVDNYETVFNKININKNSYIVIVTRGHKFDELVLQKAIETNANYIGMIGSKRKVILTLKTLKEKGIPEEKIKKIYTPVGLSIGAITPEEIALSIVSELVKVRRIGDAQEIKHMKLILN